MLLNTEGLILKEQNIGESDRLVTVLTRQQGLMRAFVRGAKRIKNRNASSTQLLCYSRLSVYRGKEKNVIDEAEPLEVFFELRQDIEKLALAQYFCELTLALAPEDGEAGEFLRLVLNALYLLAHGKRPPAQIKAVLEMRMLSLAGYLPDLLYCQGCGAYESDTVYFLPRQGILLCHACYTKARRREGVPLGRGVLTALRHTVYADFEKVFSFTMSEKGLYSLALAAEQYVAERLERSFATLHFYHQIKT